MFIEIFLPSTKEGWFLGLTVFIVIPDKHFFVIDDVNGGLPIRYSDYEPSFSAPRIYTQ
jgi:hypothetical protein